MELEGCKRSFQFLKLLGLSISVFISDQHRSIAKWIRVLSKHETLLRHLACGENNYQEAAQGK